MELPGRLIRWLGDSVSHPIFMLLSPQLGSRLTPIRCLLSRELHLCVLLSLPPAEFSCSSHFISKSSLCRPKEMFLSSEPCWHKNIDQVFPNRGKPLDSYSISCWQRQVIPPKDVCLCSGSQSNQDDDYTPCQLDTQSHRFKWVHSTLDSDDSYSPYNAKYA